LPFYDFCGFRSVAVNSVYKLQFFYIYFVNGQASKPYRITGIYLLIISCKTTSSDALRPISPKIAFTLIKHVKVQTVNNSVTS